MDNKRKIGEEELKRALLMMKYDNKKTLTENVQDIENKQVLNEWLGLVAGLGRLIGGQLAKKGLTRGLTTAAKKTTTKGSFINAAVDFLAIGALTDYVSSLFSGGDSEQSVRDFFDGCPTHLSKLSPTNSDIEIQQAADKIYQNSEGQDFYEGFGMGNEEEIRKVLKSMNGIADLCQLQKVYEDRYTTSFVEALDNEFMSDDLVEYVWLPIKDKLDLAKNELEQLQQDGQTESGTGVMGEVEKNAISCGWVKSDGSADVEGYKNSNWYCKPSSTDGGTTDSGSQTDTYVGGGSYQPCEGTYTRGCFSEKIRDVQTCLGNLVPDGKFGPKTQAALERVGYGDGFKDSDIDKICSVSTMPEPDLDLPTPDDEGIDLLNM